MYRNELGRTRSIEDEGILSLPGALGCRMAVYATLHAVIEAIFKMTDIVYEEASLPIRVLMILL